MDYEYLVLPNGSMGVASCPDGEIDTATEVIGDGIEGGKHMERVTYGSYGMWCMSTATDQAIWRFASRPICKQRDGSNLITYYPSNTATGGTGSPAADSMKDPSECTLLADSRSSDTGSKVYVVIRKIDNSGVAYKQVSTRHSGSANLLFADGHAIAADKSNLVKFGWDKDKGTVY